MRRILFLVMIFVSSVSLAADKDLPQKSKTQASLPDLEKTIASIQKQYDQIKNFSADFTQEFTHKILKKKEQSSGKVKFKKPGKMRWDYEKPNEKSFIVDGESLWIYQPKDKSVMVNKCFKEDKITASLSFLWGQGDISNLFDKKFFKGQFGSDTDLHIQLTPKEKSLHYKRLILVVDPMRFSIKQSVVVDLEGNVNQFIFSNINFEQQLNDKDFVFTTPKGVVESLIPGSEEACKAKKTSEMK